MGVQLIHDNPDQQHVHPMWRATWDRKVNFTPQNMIRLSLARRF